MATGTIPFPSNTLPGPLPPVGPGNVPPIIGKIPQLPMDPLPSVLGGTPSITGPFTVPSGGVTGGDGSTSIYLDSCRACQNGGIAILDRIGACLNCFFYRALGSVLLVILLLLGIYLLFRPEVNKAVSTAGKAALA